MWNEEAYIDRAIETATAECRSLMERNEILDYELIVVWIRTSGWFTIRSTASSAAR